MQQIQTLAHMTLKHITIKHITKACGGKLVLPEEYKMEENREKTESILNREATQVVIDSRLVQEGGVFIATVGERVDGHNFIGQVFEKSALAVICEKLPEMINGPMIQVADSFQALKDLAEFYRKQLTVRVVGITGSVGKTSTKEMIASVLEQKYQVLKTQGNFNNEVGLPLTVLSLRSHHEVAVLEMGISDFGEMHRLSKVARPDIAVITNIGQCHLENLKTRDGILQAKTEIFDYMPDHGIAILNGEDDKLETITLVKGKVPITFGTKISHDYSAKNIQSLGLKGSTCTMILKTEKLEVRIPLPGEHMVQNALCAAAVGMSLSLSKEEIKAGIEAVSSLSGRSNLIQTKDYLLIDDCYNANPVSMKAAITTLSLANTRTVAILGDMFELGLDEVLHHEEIGIHAVEKQITLLLFVGVLSKHAYLAAIKKSQEITGCKDVNPQILWFPGKEELFSKLPELLKKEDTILIKASHGMKFDEIIQFLNP